MNKLQLNKEEFEQLKEAYVSTIVDSMSMKDLVDYVKTDYYNSLDKYNELLKEFNNDSYYFFN